MEVFYRDLLPPTAEHESSMLQDLQAGRPTEIDVLCGAVDRLARKFNIASPVNTALLALIRAAERNSGTDPQVHGPKNTESTEPPGELSGP
jgi:2-dehydropantoate 2-reductase